MLGISPLMLVDGLVASSGYAVDECIPYGPEARHRLDVYSPTGGLRSKAVVLFLYGGGWKSGGRGHYRFVGQALASRGVHVVIPDYRLYPEVRFPCFVEDVARAICWVNREMPRLVGDPARIVVAGHSAGAHIAALIALDPTYLDAAEVELTTIAGWIGLAGPYAFDPAKNASTRAIFATAKNPDDARPISFVRPDAPPALLLHGTDDAAVSPRNSVQLARDLRIEETQVRYLPLADVGHIGILLALARPFERRAPVIASVMSFLDELETQ
jgi:acetyl esterase/lipase